MTSIEYAAYLQSEHWRETRRDALERAGHRCQSPLCRLDYLRGLSNAELAFEKDEYLPPHAYRLEVHHKTYERVGHEQPDDLIVLCPECHATTHGIPYADQPFTKSLADALVGAIVEVADRFMEGPR